MEIKFNLSNPFKSVRKWFLYDKCFWRIKKVSIRKLDRVFYFDLVYMEMIVIYHIFTGNILHYSGWGDKLHQHAIYQVNGMYEDFKKALDKSQQPNQNQ